jgi:threonine dehydratase
MLTLEAVQSAHERIRESIRVTPLLHSTNISELSGSDVFLKLDNLQRTGSFKERGALNRILTLSQDERGRGVIAASAGNHAQAVAYHASRLGIAATICMPLATPLVKVSATRGYGAEVVLHGRSYDEAYQEAVVRCEREGYVFVHPFDDEAVMAGQGTLGLELFEQAPDLEAVLVPVGGGGLISGVACALKALHPAIRVVGVQTSRLPSMLNALLEGGPVTLPRMTTIADGIAVRRAGDRTFVNVRQFVDEVVTVDEEEIANAILQLLEKEKILAEGAGAVAVAALLNNKVQLRNKKVAALVCGGNIDVTLLARIIERGLVRDGRLIRLRIHLADHPGSLRELTEVIELQQANIVETLHDRAYYGVNLGDTVIDLTLETRGQQHAAALTDALTAAGYVYQRVL